jgi:hypothetical protein
MARSYFFDRPRDDLPPLAYPPDPAVVPDGWTQHAVLPIPSSPPREVLDAIVRDVPTRTPAASLQRRRIYRWVAAVGLLGAAEDQRGADVPETNAIGLMAAHAACEAMLGLIIGPLPYAPKQPPRERYFGTLLELALAASKPPLSNALRDDLLTMHDVRNSFVHGGSTVSLLELDRAIDAAHALAEHVSLPGHKNLVGVPTVVADIIQIEAIGMWLRHADEQRAKGNILFSADGIARALDEAVGRTVPLVRRRTGRTMLQSLRTVADHGKQDRHNREVSGEFERQREAIDALARWVYPLALGTQPATLNYIESVVGTVDHVDIGGQPLPVNRPKEEPSPRDLRRASSLVSRIILRLWAMDGLAPGRFDDQLIELAQRFLTQPYGMSARLPREPQER